MRLDQCDVRPGKVLKVIDNYGSIKASVPGLFSEEDDPDLLPPITPFIISSPTSFSMPHEGDYVWIWYFWDNPQELLYSFRCNTQKLNGNSLNNEYKDVEISMKRKSDKGDINVEYNNDDGYTINNADTKINIDNDKHDIHINHADGNSVSISKDSISLGKDGKSEYKAVCGEELVKCLNDIKTTFDTIKTSAMGSPYTSHIGTAMNPVMAKLNNFEKILSNLVTLEK